MDFLCCRHVLEHIDGPLQFLQQIRMAIGDRTSVRAYFEVPDASYTFAGPGLWDVIYEHCSYFTKASLQRLFTLAGFIPISAGTDYGGQFLWMQVRGHTNAAPMPSAPRSAGESPALTPEGHSPAPAPVAFAATFQAGVNSWLSNLRSLHATGKTLLVWGAGSKGVTWLNSLGVTPDLIADVVDLNPAKHGKFIPGTCQRIVSPDSLSKHTQYAIVVMNPVYTQEILGIITSLGLRAQLTAA
jgi:hypothetical protein